jgi:ribosomal protein L40E
LLENTSWFDLWYAFITMAQVCPRCQAELVAGARFCHQCGRRVQSGASGAFGVIVRIAIAAAAVDGLIAWLLLFVKVESVLFTGPILFFLGIILILGSRPVRFWRGGILGVLHCGIFVLLVMLVNLFHWSPDNAKVPFIIMGGMYLLGTLPLGVFAYRNVPASYDPSRCSRCGYLLYGLTEPRCPECGTPCDLSSVGGPPAVV